MANETLHALVDGDVQGVGFRYTAVHRARSLRLTGYVRNCSDGRVEVVAEGERDELERLKAWLAHGPPGAWVRSVESQYTPYRGLYREFSVRY